MESADVEFEVVDAVGSVRAVGAAVRALAGVGKHVALQVLLAVHARDEPAAHGTLNPRRVVPPRQGHAPPLQCRKPSVRGWTHVLGFSLVTNYCYRRGAAAWTGVWGTKGHAMTDWSHLSVSRDITRR